jgi:hypothetical protein
MQSIIFNTTNKRAREYYKSLLAEIVQLRSLLAALTQHQQLHRAFLGGLSTQNDDQGTN